MPDLIPWSAPAMNDDGPCGTLRDVVVRWKCMASRDHEAITGVTVDHPVHLPGWAQPHTELTPKHLDELADHLRDAVLK